MPENFYLGGGAQETVMSTATAMLTLLTVISAIAFPRKYALASAICGVLLIPSGNVIVLGGAHLTTVRIIAIAGLLRVIRDTVGSTRAVFAAGVNVLDRLFLAWALSHALAFIALWQTSAAVVNQCGFLVSTVGMYVVLRHFIRVENDVRRVIQVLAVVAVLNAAGMIYEQFTRTNPFAMLGGISAVPGMRDVHVRSQGVFQHPLLAGAFGAVTLPLFVLLWQTFRLRVWAIIGVLSSAVMVFCTWSSTPFFGFLGAIGAVCIWPLRGQMRIVRWAAIIGLIGLQLCMRAPVWFVIQRVELSGSSGYHRALLLDHFVRRIGEWWLVGTNNNASWSYEAWDTSNEFVMQGQTGGLLTFTLFLVIIYRAFRNLGMARRRVIGTPRYEWSVWLLGAAVFANILAFFGVTYWDQVLVVWLTTLALIPVVALACAHQKKQMGLVRERSSDEQSTTSIQSRIPDLLGNTSPGLRPNF